MSWSRLYGRPGPGIDKLDAWSKASTDLAQAMEKSALAAGSRVAQLPFNCKELTLSLQAAGKRGRELVKAGKAKEVQGAEEAGNLAEVLLGDFNTPRPRISTSKCTAFETSMTTPVPSRWDSTTCLDSMLLRDTSAAQSPDAPWHHSHDFSAHAHDHYVPLPTINCATSHSEAGICGGAGDEHCGVGFNAVELGPSS